MVNHWIHRLTRRSALVVAGFAIAMAGSFVVGHTASAKTSKTIAVCNDPTDCATAQQHAGQGVVVVDIHGMSASQAASAVKTTANKTGATSVVTLGGTAAVSANYNKQIANTTGLTTVQLGGATGTQTANMLGSYLNGNTSTSSLYNLSKSGADRGTYTSTGNIYAGQGQTSNASGYYGDVGVSVYQPTTTHKKKTTPQPTGCTSNCGTSTLHYTPPPGTSTEPSTTSTPPSTTSTPPPVYYPPPPVWTTQYRTWTETSWGNGTSYNQAACAAQGGTSTGQAQGTITTYFTESWQVSNYGQSTAPATTSSSSFTPSDWQCKAVSGSPYWQPDGTTVSYPDRNLSAVCNADAVGTVNVTPTQQMQNWAYWWTQTGPSQSTTQAVSLGTTGQQYKYAVTAGTCPGGVVDTSVGTNNGQFVHLASALNANLLEPLQSATSSTTVPESLGTVTWQFQQGTGSTDNGQGNSGQNQGNGGGIVADGGNPGNVSVPVVGTVSKTVPVTTTKTVQATCTVPHQETAYRTVDEVQTIPETQNYTYTVDVAETETGTHQVQQSYTAYHQVPVTHRTYVNTSHYVTTTSYVKSGYWATGSRYVASGYWASSPGHNVCGDFWENGRSVHICHWVAGTRHYVNTGHYVSYQYYVNTSHTVTSRHLVTSGYWKTTTTYQTAAYTAYRTVSEPYTYTVEVPETRTGTRTVYVQQTVPVQQAYTTTVLTEESCTKQEQVTTYQTVSATGVIMTSLGTAIAHNATYTVNGQTFTETTWTLT